MSNVNIKYKGATLHKGQGNIIKNIQEKNCKFNIVNASRQSGKTFLLKQIVLFNSINNEKSESLIVSPYNSQNTRIYNELQNAIKPSNVIRNDLKSEKIIELINGSTIVFKSAENFDSIRGGSYDYVYCDEFAYFKSDAWKMAIRPTMAAKKNSRAYIFSTPRGRGEFFELASLGRADEKNYSYSFMSYRDNPLYDKSFVEDCKRFYPAAKFNQEFEGEFIDGGSVFDNYLSCATIDSWREPEKNKKYYAGLDLARKKDKTILTIMDNDGNVVFIYEKSGGSWGKIVEDVVSILKKYNAQCLVEVNSIGDVVYELLCNVYYNLDSIFTTNSNKQEYVEELIHSFLERKIRIPSNDLCSSLHLELDVFDMDFSNKTRKIVYKAREGFHDDHIISLCLANKCKKDNYYGVQESSGPVMYFGGERI